MKVGPVEITLIHPEDGSEFEERVVEGKTHFVAVVGQQFRVRVTVHNFDRTYPRVGYLRVFLTLDGENISNYTLNLEELAIVRRTIVFHGFPHSDSYSTFEFKGQGFTFDALPDQNDSKLGTISLSIKSSTRIERPRPIEQFRRNGQSDAPKEDPNFKVKPHKKLWQQPSVCTGSGSVKFERNTARGASKFTFRNDGRYEEEITVPYHTAEVLDLWEKSLIVAEALLPFTETTTTETAVTSSQSVSSSATHGTTKEDGNFEDDTAAATPLTKKRKVFDLVDVGGVQVPSDDSDEVQIVQPPSKKNHAVAEDHKESE